MMKKLVEVTYTYKRYATDDEKVREWYVIKDGMRSECGIAYTQLRQNFTITLDEAREIYEKLIAKVDPKEGEEVSDLKIDLTEYYEYNAQGLPRLSSDEYPESHCASKRKVATYSAKLNRLRIWERGDLVYQNWDGEICTDEAALADTYL